MNFVYHKCDKWYVIKSCGKAKCEALPDLKITQFQGHLFLEIFTLHQINHTYLKYILLDTKYPTWHHRMNLVHFCASGQCRSLPLLQTDWGSQKLSQFAAKTQPIMTWNLLLCVWVKQFNPKMLWLNSTSKQ